MNDPTGTLPKSVLSSTNPMETITERLRRLTKEALNTGTENKYGPKPEKVDSDNPPGAKRLMRGSKKGC